MINLVCKMKRHLTDSLQIVIYLTRLYCRKLPCCNKHNLLSITIYIAIFLICLFVLGFYGPVNNEVMSSRSVNSGSVPGQS